jgi:ELWxxDGT repeat protein
MPPLPAPPTRSVLIPALVGLALSAAGPIAAQPPLLRARLVQDLTEVVPAVHPQSVWPRELVRLGNRIFFVASGFSEAATDQEVWVTDGTSAGTRRLTALNTEAPCRPLQGLTVLGDRLFFTYGSALWVLDTTTEVARPLSPQSTYPHAAIFITMIAADVLYYRLIDADSHLCRSDGTVPGTFCIDTHVAELGVALGRRLLFVADDSHDREPWVASNGESVAQLRDIAPGSFASSDPGGWAVFDGAALFFAADDGRAFDLWRTDGTPPGTQRVADIDVYLLGNVFGFRQVIDLRRHLYFTAGDATHLARAWRSDGTQAGTTPLAAGPDEAGVILPIARAGGRLLALSAGGQPTELWSFDPATGGSTKLASVASTWRDAVSEIAGRTIFTSCTAGRGCEPWISDGTAAGTHQLANIAPRATSSAPTFYTRLGAEIVFVASDGTGPPSLWALPAPLDDPCSGDCSGNGEVTIDELVNGIGIASAGRGIDRCVSMDRAGDGSVGIDDLVAAVGHALDGCFP